MLPDIRAQTEFSVLVKPNAKTTELLGFDERRACYLVAIKAPPEHNRANVEVVKFFSKLLGRQVRIVRGLTNKRKVLRTTSS